MATDGSEAFDFLSEYESALGIEPQTVFQNAWSTGDVSGGVGGAGGENIMESIVNFVTNTMQNATGTITTIFCVALLGVFLSCGTDESKNVRKAASLILTAVCLYPATADLISAAGTARDAISDMTALMTASVPALMTATLTISSSAAIFLIITQLCGALMRNIFMPLTIFQAALGLCDSMTDRFELKDIRNVFKGIFTWGLGAMMLIFGVASTLSGAVTGVKATVAGRSLRYAGSVIPVVGRYLSESAEMIYAGASALRAAGGIGVSVAVIACMLEPFLRLLVYVAMYKLSSFILRPFAPEKVCRTLDTVGESFSALAGMTILTSSIALINIAVIVRAGSGGV